MKDPYVREIEIAGPAGRLQASLSSPDKPLLQALVAHPHPLYGGTMDNLVVVETGKAFSRRGAETLRFNFRGVGSSDGAHSQGRGEVEDLRAAFARLCLKDRDTPRMLAGYSFGSAMVLGLLAQAESLEQEPCALLLLAPPMTHYDFAALQDCTLPMAVIYGEKDDLTPSQMVRSSLGSRSSELTLVTPIEGVGHDLGTSASGAALRDALEVSLDWLLASVRP